MLEAIQTKNTRLICDLKMPWDIIRIIRLKKHDKRFAYRHISRLMFHKIWYGCTEYLLEQLLSKSQIFALHSGIERSESFLDEVLLHWIFIDMCFLDLLGVCFTPVTLYHFGWFFFLLRRLPFTPRIRYCMVYNTIIRTSFMLLYALYVYALLIIAKNSCHFISLTIDMDHAGRGHVILGAFAFAAIHLSEFDNEASMKPLRWVLFGYEKKSNCIRTFVWSKRKLRWNFPFSRFPSLLHYLNRISLYLSRRNRPNIFLPAACVSCSSGCAVVAIGVVSETNERNTKATFGILFSLNTDRISS